MLAEAKNCYDEPKFAESKFLKKSTTVRRKRSMPEENSSSSQEQKKKITEKQWTVAKLVDHKLQEEGLFFRVRWRGYKSSEDTWEPETNLNCQKLLSSYKSSKCLVSINEVSLVSSEKNIKMAPFMSMRSFLTFHF